MTMGRLPGGSVMIYIKSHLPVFAVSMLILMLVMACFTGCGDQISENKPSHTIVQESQTSEAIIPTETIPIASNAQNDEITLGESFLAHSNPHSGSLNCTVTGARVLGPDSDITLSIDQFFPYTFIPDVEMGKYPEFLDDNGHLSPGCYLVQADITIENVDAQSLTDEYGNPWLFRADDLFLLNLDLPGKCKTVDFFSQMGEYEAHPMLYRLEPGDAAQYTIGFLVDETWAVDGASSLRISQSMDFGDLKINLQLGGSSSE